MNWVKFFCVLLIIILKVKKPFIRIIKNSIRDPYLNFAGFLQNTLTLRLKYISLISKITLWNITILFVNVKKVIFLLPRVLLSMLFMVSGLNQKHIPLHRLNQTSNAF